MTRRALRQEVEKKKMEEARDAAQEIAGLIRDIPDEHLIKSLREMYIHKSPCAEDEVGAVFFAISGTPPRGYAMFLPDGKDDCVGTLHVFDRLGLKRKILHCRIVDLADTTFMPRLDFDERRFKSLSEDILRFGQRNPIGLRENEERFQVIYGWNRIKAFQLLGRDEIEARNYGEISDLEAQMHNIQTTSSTRTSPPCR